MAVQALASAYVNIIPSMKGFNKTLSDEITGGASKAGDNAGMQVGTSMKKGILGGLSGVGAAVGGLLAAAGVGIFIKDTIQSASQLQDTVAAAGTVFGKEADSLNKWAEGASKAFGASQQQALDAALTFGTFGKAAGLSGTELATFSTDLSQLAGDMASFRGTSTEQAIEAVGAALRGESEPIRAYGVLLDEATLKATAMEMGIYDGNGALTQQQKVLAAQAAIFKQTGDAQGDYARTSDSAANTQKTFLMEIENLKAGIGTELLPIFTELVQAFSDSLPTLKESLIPAVKDLAQGFRDFLPVVLGVLDYVRDNWEWLSKLALAIGAVAIALGLANVALGIYHTVVGIATAASLIFNSAIWANPMTWVIAAIIVAVGLLVAAIWLIASNWDAIVLFVTDLLNHLGSFFETVFSAIGEWWNGVVNGIVSGFQAAVSFISGILNTLGGFFATIWNGIGAGFRGTVNFIIGLFEGMINFIINGINNFLRLLNGGLGAIKDITGIDLNIGMIGNVNLPRLAKGGFVDQPTTALIGEAGPEVVIPLDRFETMMGMDGKSNGPTIIYNAAENRSMSKEQELLDAMKRAKIQGAF